MKKQFLATVMAACMAVSLAGCSSSSNEASKAEETAKTETAEAGKTEETAEAEKAEGEEKTLVVATNAEFPPYEFYENDTIVGIDAEIAEAIGEKLGMKVVIEDMAFDAIIPTVTSGKADFGIAGMTVTEKRQKSVDFTDTYASSMQVAIINADSDIKTAADLEGKAIGVQLGTTGDILAGDITDKVERFNKGLEAVQSLKQGKIDAVMIDQATADAFLAKNEGLKILEEKLSEEDYAMVVKKGNTELVEQLNGAIEELKDEGKLDEIVGKYIKAE